MIKVGIVGMIPIDKVIISDRAREVMGDLEGLENSMKESGLISPLAVKDNHDGTYTLLAGERRFTVLKKNEAELIPARIYSHDLSSIEMKVIEKSENFYRKDMEYWEFDRLTKEIHELQQSIHGVKGPGPGEGWGTAQTGELLGMTKFPVSTAIKRAEAREAFPELFDGCKTASDASKVLKKIDEAMIKQAVAQKLETSSNKSDLKLLSKQYIIKDFFEGVKEIPNEIMHLVEIDPPYGIELGDKKKGDTDFEMQDYNEVPRDKYQVFISKLFHECYRVMTEHSWLLCWFAPEPWFEIIYQELNNAGFHTSRMCGIWTKGYGQSMNPNFSLANSYEMFFYARKGSPVLNAPGRANDFRFSPVPASQKVHPTERPIELMQEIYSTFAFPGSRILIPFLGSGNGIIAAHNLNMTAVGFELGKSFKDSFLVKVNELIK